MSIPRRTLFGKLNVDLFRAIEAATVSAKLRSNPYVEVVHWLHQLWQVPHGDFHRLVTHYALDSAQVERDLTVALGHLPTGATGINDFGHMVELAIERAWVFASLVMRDQRIRGAWLLGGMLQTPELRRVLLGISATFQGIAVAQMAEEFPLAIRGSSEDAAMAHESTDWQPALPGEACDALHPETQGQPVLARYCADLTALAREGGIDPVVGREQEIRAMVDILLRRRQNNPLLTGEAGVGKTAVVEGLAIAVVGAQVPPSLRRVRILSLDVGALLAGASMRGEFESRLKAVLREAADSPVPVILFVDEVHTLIGAGGQAGTGDAANLLKPALARGAFRVIGATTWSEYKKHIEKDPALTRRFQMLQVSEPHQRAQLRDSQRLLSGARILQKNHFMRRCSARWGLSIGARGGVGRAELRHAAPLRPPPCNEASRLSRRHRHRARGRGEVTALDSDNWMKGVEGQIVAWRGIFH